jgi:hypothetical protein
MSNQKIHFIAYLNRSGSTLLARKLNDFEDMAVSLEAKFSNYVIEKLFIENENHIDKWINILYKDKKFRKWNVQKETLKKKLAEIQKPIRFKDFLKVALQLHLRDEKKAKYIFYKSRTFWGNLEKKEEIFPESVHIFIDRDPRAIFNSQSKSVDSQTKQIMQSDIEKFALDYKKNQKRITYNLKNENIKDKILIIRYENLIQNEDYEINKILTYFSASKNKFAKRDYSEKIPDEQKHLHEKLRKGNLKRRINAWKTELDNDEIRYLNLVLRNEILENGYELKKNNFIEFIVEPIIIIKLISFWIKFFPKHYIKSLFLVLGIRKYY